MKIAILVIPILVIISSCNYSKSNKTTDEKALPSTSDKIIHEENVYALINDFILDSLYKTNLLAIEAMGFYNTKLDTNIIYNLGRYCSYDNTLFEDLIKLNIVDSLALKSILEQISRKEQLEWDSTRVRLKTFSFFSLEDLVQKNKGFDPYDYTKKRYNTTNFLILSNPIFLDNHTILMGVSYFCNGLCGHGKIYVFNMQIDGKWKILFSDFNWIS